MINKTKKRYNIAVIFVMLILIIYTFFPLPSNIRYETHFIIFFICLDIFEELLFIL